MFYFRYIIVSIGCTIRLIQQYTNCVEKYTTILESCIFLTYRVAFMMCWPKKTSLLMYDNLRVTSNKKWDTRLTKTMSFKQKKIKKIMSFLLQWCITIYELCRKIMPTRQDNKGSIKQWSTDETPSLPCFYVGLLTKDTKVERSILI